jgi:hypothetical protein
MSRKPIHLERTGGKGPRQKIWEVIRRKRDGFLKHDIAFATNLDDATVRSYLQSLLKGGYIKVIQEEKIPGIAKRCTYQLVRDNGIEAPRLDKQGVEVTQGRANENMWGTMRRLANFNAHELAMLASVEKIIVAESTAARYITMLHRAGYLDLIEPAQQLGGRVGAKPARYRLLINKWTGPRPPMIQRTRCVYDPNLGKIVWQEEADHDAC